MHQLFLIIALIFFGSSAKIAISWGQDLGFMRDGLPHQRRLIEYCWDTPSDIILLSFATDAPDTPVHFSTHCDQVFPGTDYSHCPQLSRDIASCQAMGKKVLLTLAPSYAAGNGAIPANYAETLLRKFGARSFKQKSRRPFDDVVVDGFHFIPAAGRETYYVDLAKKIKQLDPHMKLAVTPSCVSEPLVMRALAKVHLDYWFVQFDTDVCMLNEMSWNSWSVAAKASPNPTVQVFVALFGDKIGPFGYVNVTEVKSKLPIFQKDSSFGGFAIWDASLSEGNKNYAKRLFRLVV